MWNRLTPREREICATIGPALEERDLGVDVTGRASAALTFRVADPDGPRARVGIRPGIVERDLEGVVCGIVLGLHGRPSPLPWQQDERSADVMA